MIKHRQALSEGLHVYRTRHDEENAIPEDSNIL